MPNMEATVAEISSFHLLFSPQWNLSTRLTALFLNCNSSRTAITWCPPNSMILAWSGAAWMLDFFFSLNWISFCFFGYQILFLLLLFIGILLLVPLTLILPLESVCNMLFWALDATWVQLTLSWQNLSNTLYHLVHRNRSETAQLCGINKKFALIDQSYRSGARLPPSILRCCRRR